MNKTVTIPIAVSRNDRPQRGQRLFLSVVSAAFGEARNLPILYERLREILDQMDIDWEWVIVDDHSRDDTFAVLRRLAKCDPRVRGLRFSRNCGSHTAMACGLSHARGDCAVFVSADLQDPPEIIPELLEEWRRGVEVVWAVRRRRQDERRRDILFARLYYFLMRRVVGVKEIPANGADFFLIGRRGLDALEQYHEGNVSILGLIAWMGFPTANVFYDKQPRMHGRSGWSLDKKLKLVADSVTAFSYLPIRIMSLLGVLFALGGMGLVLYTVIERLVMGHNALIAGYATTMIVLLLGFGFVMTFLGVLGEYLWRTFDEVRGRPRYIIEQTTNLENADPVLDIPFTDCRSELAVPRPDESTETVTALV